MSDVAVIVVNWNAGLHLRACVESILSQTAPAKQVIVVDNASTDGSADFLLSEHPSVDRIQMDSNTGFAAANNRAIAYANDCRWIALLNPDAVARSDWLENLLKAARDHPDYSFFGCRQLDAANPTILDGAGDIYHVSGLAWRRFHGHPDHHNARSEVEEVFSPCAAAALFDRSAVQRAGGFDERFFCYFEDVDLSFRLRLAGHRCAYVPDAVVSHVGSATTAADSDFAVYHGHRNLVWTFFKNMPRRLLWRYLPQHILLNVATILHYTRLGRPGVAIRSKWHAFRDLPEVLRQRRAVQSSAIAEPGRIKQWMSSSWLTPYRRNRY